MGHKINKCLVTGCGGFIGSYLAEFLLAEGVAVYGTVYRDTRKIEHLKDAMTILNCDVSNKREVNEIVAEVQPDTVFHLAAQSLIAQSRKKPETTLTTNLLGTLYLLEAIRRARIDPVVVVVGSSSEYGLSYENETPIKENKEFRPSSPYAVSKVALDMLAYAYFQGLQMKTVRVRPFYIVGPRKTFDVCSDLARGIVRIERGQQNSLKVGNLEAVRDVVDIRDAVKALRLLAEKGEAGKVYNLCSGKGYRVREILDIFISLSTAKVEVQIDSRRMRPVDEPLLVGDNSKLQRLGWKPQIPLETSLADILNFWREEPVDN